MDVSLLVNCALIGTPIYLLSFKNRFFDYFIDICTKMDVNFVNLQC